VIGTRHSPARDAAYRREWQVRLDETRIGRLQRRAPRSSRMQCKPEWRDRLTSEFASRQRLGSFVRRLRSRLSWNCPRPSAILPKRASRTLRFDQRYGSCEVARERFYSLRDTLKSHEKYRRREDFFDTNQHALSVNQRAGSGNVLQLFDSSAIWQLSTNGIRVFEADSWLLLVARPSTSEWPRSGPERFGPPGFLDFSIGENACLVY